MIQKLLPPEKCAECKGCCFFDKEDDWEIPGSVTAVSKNGMLVCDFLSEDGCSLKSNKPLECSLYPLRIMRFCEREVLALCRYCKIVTKLPLSSILDFTETQCGELFTLADQHPEIVKEYNREYIILKVKE
ncbi:MAG: hypothetical protein FWG33_03020 [Oscillospiraceae bacterium]|nr:hypothetical protein [Oscillospiraceae bacterium]